MDVSRIGPTTNAEEEAACVRVASGTSCDDEPQWRLRIGGHSLSSCFCSCLQETRAALRDHVGAACCRHRRRFGLFIGAEGNK